MHKTRRLFVKLLHYAIENPNTDYLQLKNPCGGEIGQLIQKFSSEFSSSISQLAFKTYTSRAVKRFFVVSTITLIGLYLKRDSPDSTLEIIFDNLESIALGSAGIIFLLESEDRRKRDHYEAWQVINLAQNQPSSGGRVQALQDLNQDNVDLEGIDLHGADLSGINLPFGQLARANMKKAHLDHANLNKANLVAAHLEGINLQSAHLEDSNLQSAHLVGANLNHAHLENALLSNTNLKDANLEFAHLEGTVLYEVNFENANLGYAYLQCTNLCRANLEGAELGRGEMEGAVLHHANLKGASLHKACLKSADLWRADLEGAWLCFANLEGADLSESNLKNISWNDKIKWTDVIGIETAKNISPALQNELSSLGLLPKNTKR